VLAWLAVLLLLSACTNLEVVNNSKFPATVQVQAPGFSAGKWIQVGPSESTSFFSLYGGKYSVYVKPAEEYLNMIAAAKEAALFILLANKTVSTSPAQEAGQSMKEVFKWLNASEDEGAASCSGNLVDYGSAVATITNSGGSSAEIWSAVCVSSAPSSESSNP
jgi:hypothetical protein